MWRAVPGIRLTATCDEQCLIYSSLQHVMRSAWYMAHCNMWCAVPGIWLTATCDVQCLVYGSLQHVTHSAWYTAHCNMWRAVPGVWLTATCDMQAYLRPLHFNTTFLCSACVTDQKEETTANPWPKYTGWQEETCQQPPQTVHQSVLCAGCQEKILAHIFDDIKKTY
jgi:hypothetical protein